jgi:hypothetical protein
MNRKPVRNGLIRSPSYKGPKYWVRPPLDRSKNGPKKKGPLPHFYGCNGPKIT